MEQPLIFNLAQTSVILYTSLTVEDVVNKEGKLNLDLHKKWFITDMVNHIFVIPHSFPEDGEDK